jgi:hypothetical protein
LPEAAVEVAMAAVEVVLAAIDHLGIMNLPAEALAHKILFLMYKQEVLLR